jgi:hypothetical protein
MINVGQCDEDRVDPETHERSQIPARLGPDGLGRGLRRLGHGVGDTHNVDPTIAREGLQVPPPHGAGTDQTYLHAHKRL